MDNNERVVNKYTVEQLLAKSKTPEKKNDRKIELVSDVNKLKQQIEEHRRLGGKIIYEVGFGGLFCVNLGKNDLSIGVDPMDSSRNRVTDKNLENESGSKRIFFNEEVSALPDNIFPDCVVMVAPSPERYQEIMDQLSVKTDGNTRIIVFVENQSQQAADGAADNMVRDIGKRLLRDVSIEDDVVYLNEDFSQYLEDVGIRHGGELHTAPWDGSGDWMVVSGRGLKEVY